MRTSKYSEEQIIGFLKQAEAGMPIKELCRNGFIGDHRPERFAPVAKARPSN